jgi:isoquinoline 1-oxidoreductase beta subunit
MRCGRIRLRCGFELLAGDDVLSAGDGDAMLKIDRRRLRRVISLAAEKGEWGRRAGLGFACNVYDGSTHVAYVVEMKGTQVERVVAAVDCGQVINPTGVEQQIEGGIIWALSQALKGSITFRDGRAEQTSFVDYEVARLRDAPKIEVQIVKNEDAPPSGMGEPPVPPLAPAVANAIFAATGKRIRRLPLA